MKILHILNDGPMELAAEIIEAQAKENEVRVIDLTKEGVSYDAVVDEIFACDRVISW